MNTPIRLLALGGLLATLSQFQCKAQNLPGSLSFNVTGAFQNGVAETSNSLLITDNNLTNGYRSGLDLHDAPASLTPSGPAGSAMFQWGQAAKSGYSHASALWFEPTSASQVMPEQSFDLGYLYYRNGTINSGTGASWVDLALSFNFSDDSDIAPFTVVFGSQLINTPNTSDPVASADIVSLGNLSAPISFTDAEGNQYHLELTFRVDQDTLDGTLSTESEFRVFEGGMGRAELVGRFTTTPVQKQIPEPSSALLAAIGSLALLRRKRRH